jgi:hypothetical protein
MSDQKFVIAFSKWHDPWGGDEDNKDDGYDTETAFDDDDEDKLDFEDKQEAALEKKRPKPMKSLMTPMGPIPLNEHTSPSANWNFWTGHSNFRITRNLARIISKVDGVETLDVFSPYRIRIGIGKLFQPGQVIGRITQSVNKELNKTIVT